MDRTDADARITAIAVLGEPLRRSLYRYVAAHDRAVSRDEAAHSAGVSRSVAAFHLDRLVQEGFLTTEFRRLTGRRGPGAGRPAKLYRLAGKEVAVSIPDRRYDLAGDLLAGAITDAASSGEPVTEVLFRLARARGAATAPDGEHSTADALVEVLADCGYEPRRTAEGIALANCPFHSLATRHADLVCAMNHAYLDGLARAACGAGLAAELCDGPHCCVRFVPMAATQG